MPGQSELMNQIQAMLDEITLLKVKNERLQREIERKKPVLCRPKHLRYNPSILTQEQRQKIDYHRDQCTRFSDQIQKTQNYLDKLNKARDVHQIKMLEIQQLAMEEVEF